MQEEKREMPPWWRALPWLGGAAVFTGVCWTVWHSPETVEWVPSLLLRFWKQGSKSLVDVLPPQPVSVLAAFRLGELAERVSEADLALAGSLVQGGKLTLEQLRNMPETLALMELDQGWTSRLLGIFHLTNVLWTASIVLIGVTAVPAAYFIIAPLSGFFQRTAKWLYTAMIKPAAKFCHRCGVFETLAWCVACVLAVDSVRLTHQGPFIGLTAMVAAGVALTYSTSQRGLDFVKAFQARSSKLHLSAMHAWATASLFPLAVVHHSKLLGFLAAASLWRMLGFSIFARRLELIIGFENEDALVRSSAASALLLAGYTFARTQLLNADLMEVFGAPIAIFGSVTLGVSSLILSSDVYGEPKTYGERNLLGLASLLSLLTVGSVYLPNSGMATTGTVFLVLYGMEKYVELHLRRKWSGWVLAFLLGVAGWRGALWVHNSPELIARILEA